MDYLELSKQNAEKPIEVPTLDSWLDKYYLKKAKSNKKHVVSTSVWWNYPEILEMRPDLPPSLVKFKPEHFPDCNFTSWG